MTDQSPAQKALSAFIERQPLSLVPVDNDWIEPCLAAALEAVADEVAYQIPDDSTPEEFNRQLKIRSKLLAIAAELRGTTTNQED